VGFCFYFIGGFFFGLWGLNSLPRVCLGWGCGGQPALITPVFVAVGGHFLSRVGVKFRRKDFFNLVVCRGGPS